MKSFSLIAAVLAVLATAPAAALKVDAYSARLAKLPDLQKRAVVRRAILDNGGRCKRVIWTAPHLRYKNLTMWSARCDRGGDYGVFIGPDGSAQVRPCADLADLKMPLCRLPKPWP
jgi:hypothetical protein